MFTQGTYQMMFCSFDPSVTLEPNVPTRTTCLSYATVDGLALNFVPASYLT